MTEKQKFIPDDLSDEHILETIQSAAEESELFSAASRRGYEKLKASINSRGDAFGRSGAVVFEEHGGEVLRVPVACLPATIGCGEKAGFVLKYAGISRLHFHLEPVGSLVRICDDASTNGVFLNGKKIDKEELCDGDEVTVGAVSLRIRKG